MINATHASLIVFMCRRLLRRRRIVRRLFAIWIGIAAGGRPGRRSTPLLGCPSSIRCSPPKRKPTLHNLGAWYDKYGSSTFAKTWQEERQQGDKEALIVNASRRRVSHFFSSIVDLHNAGLVPERLKKLLTDFDGLDVFYSVVEPLEQELNPAYNKTPFDTLRNLRPPRVGLTQYAPIDWVIRDP